MCGIVGIYLKNEKLNNSLGSLLAEMLINMGSRGPDSAGFAIYNEENGEKLKYSICINDTDYENFKKELSEHFDDADIKKNSDHIILKTKKRANDVLKLSLIHI